MCSRIRVVSAGEIPIVGGDYGIRFAFLDITTIPLTNAGATGVGKDDSTEILKSFELTVSFNGGTNLLGAGCDRELDNVNWL